jgi:hypothetical protein
MDLVVVFYVEFGNSPLVNDGAYNECIKGDGMHNTAAMSQPHGVIK